MPEKKEHKLDPGKLKYYVLMFKIKDHHTWRALFGPTVELLEKQIKPPLNKTEVTAKKFFEIDRISGSFEEF